MSKNRMTPSSEQPQKSTQPMGQQVAITYALYLYREELRKRRYSYMRKTHTKLWLTNGLVSSTIKNIHKCTADDLQALTRESVFKENLRREIVRTKQQQNMLMLRYQKQQALKMQQNARQQNDNQCPQQQKDPPQLAQYCNDNTTTNTPRKSSSGSSDI